LFQFQDWFSSGDVQNHTSALFPIFFFGLYNFLQSLDYLKIKSLAISMGVLAVKLAPTNSSMLRNCGCRLMQVILYNGHKIVVVLNNFKCLFVPFLLLCAIYLKNGR